MRREVIDCDVCGEQLHTTERGEPQVRLEEFCVVLTVQCRRDRIELVCASGGGTDHSVNEVLHVCYGCASDKLSGTGPVKSFLTTGKKIPPFDTLPLTAAQAAAMGKILSVVVRRKGGSVKDMAAGSRAAELPLPLLNYPVGTEARIDGERVTIVGYKVKHKLATWDVVPPECGVCKKETSEGQRVCVPYSGSYAFEAICLGCAPRLELVADQMAYIPGGAS